MKNQISRIVLVIAAIIWCLGWLRLADAEITAGSKLFSCEGLNSIRDDLQAKKHPFTGAGPWTLSIVGINSSDVNDSKMEIEPKSAFNIVRKTLLEYTVSIKNADALIDSDRDLRRITCEAVVVRKAQTGVVAKPTGEPFCQLSVGFKPSGVDEWRPLEALKNAGRLKLIVVPSGNAEIGQINGTQAVVKRKKGDKTKTIVHLEILKDGQWTSQGDVELGLCQEAPVAASLSEPSQVETCISRQTKKCVGEEIKWFDSCGKEEATIEKCSAPKVCTNGQCVCTPMSYKGCSGKDVAWFDSCGNSGKIIETCSNNTECDHGQCITKVVTRATKNCLNGEVWWFNSNNQPTERAESCDAGYECKVGRCQRVFVKHHHKKCVNDEVYWYDSEDALDDRSESCRVGEKCENGECTKDLPPEISTEGFDESIDSKARKVAKALTLWCCQPGTKTKICEMRTVSVPGELCFCTDVRGDGYVCR